jgi:hypothetical protein
VAELIHWADIVDGAQVREPRVGRRDGRSGHEADAHHRVHAGPGVHSAADSAADRDAAGRGAQPALCGQPAAAAAGAPPGGLELIRSRAEERDGTIFFDITDHPLEGFNKFIPYYLHPEAIYSIGLSKSSFRTKVAVGSNPWTKADPAKMVNLAQVCERYGGGGHARVGAISFPPDQADQARVAAAEIVADS